ncbi:hypothetical protein KO465_06270 [Candidatus Micrarchaeota archaeon]|jgi:hypothetical protein|nr:hypothetical protein [Candidatus Micrarchaeota archaeon]
MTFEQGEALLLYQQDLLDKVDIVNDYVQLGFAAVLGAFIALVFWLFVKGAIK